MRRSIQNEEFIKITLFLVEFVVIRVIWVFEGKMSNGNDGYYYDSVWYWIGFVLFWVFVSVLIRACCVHRRRSQVVYVVDGNQSAYTNYQPVVVAETVVVQQNGYNHAYAQQTVAYQQPQQCYA